MLTYCVKCRKTTENLHSKIFKTKNGRLIMKSKCPVCGIKKSRFLKEQDAKGLLSNLGIKTLCFVLSVKMNEIANKFLLVGDKFMPEMHIKQPVFTYSACGPFTKNKERIEKVYVEWKHRKKLDKPCLKHDMTYGKIRLSKKNSVRQSFE